MSDPSRLTVSEKIVIAGYHLTEEDHTPFTAEALIVESWKRYPNTFGLAHFVEQHPCSNKVLASIMGRRGVIKRGWFTKVGQKLYRLTHEGRVVARKILFPDAEPEPEPFRLPEGQDQLLERILQSESWKKHLQGQSQEITFVTACRFWGITENLGQTNVDEQLSHVAKTLEAIQREVGSQEVHLTSGAILTSQQMHKTLELNRYLLERFHRHLGLLRARARRAS